MDMKHAHRLLALLLSLLILTALLPSALGEEAEPEIEIVAEAAEAVAEETEAPLPEADIGEEDIEVVPAPEELEAPACKHENTGWWTDVDSSSCTQRDEATHTAKRFYTTCQHECYDCGETLESIPVNKWITLQENHWFDEDGVCLDCGQKVKKGCSHSHRRPYNYSYYFLTESWHLRYGGTFSPGYAVYYCPDCGMWGYQNHGGSIEWEPIFYDVEWADAIDEILSKAESHTFKDGVCTGCGYVKDGQSAADVKPTKVTLNVSGTVELVIGETLTIKPTLTPSNASTTYTYESSKKAVAAVSDKGVVTAVSEGSAKITVKTANGKKASVKIKVTDPWKPSKIALNTKSAEMVIGGKLTLKTSLTPSNAKATLTWESSKAKVATVSGSGVVTAVGEGSAKITVKTQNGKKATCKVKVKRDDTLPRYTFAFKEHASEEDDDIWCTDLVLYKNGKRVDALEVYASHTGYLVQADAYDLGNGTIYLEAVSAHKHEDDVYTDYAVYKTSGDRFTLVKDFAVGSWIADDVDWTVEHSYYDGEEWQDVGSLTGSPVLNALKAKMKGYVSDFAGKSLTFNAMQKWTYRYPSAQLPSGQRVAHIKN